jgi:transposase
MQMAKSTRAEWAKRVERWQDSGLTAKEFAAELDVSPNSLTFWKWKLRQPSPREPSRSHTSRVSQARADTPTKFLELVPTSETSAESALDVVLASGVVLRVAKGFDESTLVRVVQLLGGR